MKRRIVAIISLVVLLFSTGSAPASSSSKSKSISEIFNNGVGAKWVDSSIIGKVSPTDVIRLEDDFAAAINQEWVTSDDAIERTFGTVMDGVYEKKLSVYNGLYEEGDKGDKGNAELIKYLDLASDWDLRNEQGYAPLLPYMQAIDDISNKEELYAWICDTEKNPFGIALLLYNVNSRSESETDKQVAYFDHPKFLLQSEDPYFKMSDADSIKEKELQEAKITYLLGRLGYSEKEAGKIIRDNYRIEKKIISAQSAGERDSVDNTTMSSTEWISLSGKYPLEKYLQRVGITKEAPLACDKKYVKKLDSLCGNANLKKMKSYLKVQLVLKAYDFLDRDTFDAIHDLQLQQKNYSKSWEYYEGDRQDKTILFNHYLSDTCLIAAFNKLYTDRYVTDEAKEVVTDMVERTIDAYREVLLDEEWLSDEGKEAAVEKLDAIVPHVIVPDNEIIDFEHLNIKSAEEGGSFLEAAIELERFRTSLNAEELYKPYDRNSWNPYESGLDTTVTNAMYMPQSNAIYINAGICEAPCYYDGISEEEMLAAIGAIVGHELTHGFDQNGIKYDKDGIEQNWFPTTDKQTFNDRVTKLQLFYTGIRPIDQTPYNGSMVGGEATADMGGIRIMLKIVEKNPDFDYDKFFRSYAAIWRSRETEEMQKKAFKGDNHPLNFLRVNVTLQQFEKFYETYDIKQGDGMYLSPEKRIAVW